MEDFRPTCFWCNRPLNKFERIHHKRENDFLCKKCFIDWKFITLNAGMKPNLEEEY